MTAHYYHGLYTAVLPPHVLLFDGSFNVYAKEECGEIFDEAGAFVDHGVVYHGVSIYYALGNVVVQQSGLKLKAMGRFDRSCSVFVQGKHVWVKAGENSAQICDCAARDAEQHSPISFDYCVHFGERTCFMTHNRCMVLENNVLRPIMEDMGLIFFVGFNGGLILKAQDQYHWLQGDTGTFVQLSRPPPDDGTCALDLYLGKADVVYLEQAGVPSGSIRNQQAFARQAVDRPKGQERSKVEEEMFETAVKIQLDREFGRQREEVDARFAHILTMIDLLEQTQALKQGELEGAFCQLLQRQMSQKPHIQ